MSKPEPFIEDYLYDTLDENGCLELQQWLKGDPAHMRQMVRELMLEEEIREAVHAKNGADSANRLMGFPTQGQRRDEEPLPSMRPDISPMSRFARAAAWLGAFTWFGNKAQAAGTTTSTILMTKTASSTAITAAILITGGGTLYLIHQENQQSIARVKHLEEVNRRGMVPPAANTIPIRPDATGSENKTNAAATPRDRLNRWRKLFSGEDLGNPQEVSKLSLEFYRKMETMNAEEFTQIAVEAEQMGDLPNMLVSLLVHSFAKKSPEGATVHGTRLAAIAPEYDLKVVASAASAFTSWLAKDPAAAHAWYQDASAKGLLVQKTIPPVGKEAFALHRHLSRIRFSALLESSPQQAEAMIPSMLPDDAVTAIQDARNRNKLQETEAAEWIRRVGPDASPDGR